MHSCSESRAYTQRYLAGVFQQLELEHRMSTLPQEIYDEIYDLVFTVEPGERVITPATKPPAQLQVSRAIRAQYAKSYYGNGSSFRYNYTQYEDKCTRKIRYLTALFTSVDKQHLQSIQQLTVVVKTDTAAASEQREEERSYHEFWFNVDEPELSGKIVVMFDDELEQLEKQDELSAAD